MTHSIKHTFNIHFTDDKTGTVLNLAKESAAVYNQSLDIFWQNLENDTLLSSSELQELITIERNLLHSQSFQASTQQAHTAILTYFKALKEFQFNPQNFSGQPMPPKKHKDSQLISFKKSAIHFKNGFLHFSLKQGLDPLKFKWNITKGLPIFATISWNPETGWQLNLVFEEEQELAEFINNRLMSIDLGFKRIAATYDVERIVTYSGKVISSLVRLRNKVNAETQSKLSGLVKYSRRYKKIKRANRRVIKRINNQINDILHKYSRMIVNDCVQNQIGKIVVGDCVGIHDAPKLGAEQNQENTQYPEQKLLKYIGYKFEQIGGVVETTPEPYTSKTCPNCGKVKKTAPTGRIFKCQGCGFEYDRDGVGALNIYRKYRSEESGILDWQSEIRREAMTGSQSLLMKQSDLDKQKAERIKASCGEPQDPQVSFEKTSVGKTRDDLDVVGSLTLPNRIKTQLEMKSPIGVKYHSSWDCLQLAKHELRLIDNGISSHSEVKEPPAALARGVRQIWPQDNAIEKINTFLSKLFDNTGVNPKDFFTIEYDLDGYAERLLEIYSDRDDDDDESEFPGWDIIKQYSADNNINEWYELERYVEKQHLSVLQKMFNEAFEKGDIKIEDIAKCEDNYGMPMTQYVDMIIKDKNGNKINLYKEIKEIYRIVGFEPY